MPKEFIVAIELGSSKMTGIAGQKNLDGSITVLATVEVETCVSIVVMKESTTSGCLNTRNSTLLARVR